MAEDEHHNVPEYLIPDEQTILAASEAERKLNKQLDTERWVYTSEPDDGKCPYCGCEYIRASWASRHEHATKGVCPYDTSISDFIVQFIHNQRHHEYHGWVNGEPGTIPATSVSCFCGPAYEDNLVSYPTTADYDITRF